MSIAHYLLIITLCLFSHFFSFAQNHSIEDDLFEAKKYESLKEALKTPHDVERLYLDFDNFARNQQTIVEELGNSNCGSMAPPPTVLSGDKMEAKIISFRKNILSRLKELPNLKYLIISQGDFITIPPEIIALNKLRYLEMRFTGLEQIDGNIIRMSKLEGLDLTGNWDLSKNMDFGKPFTQMPNLKYLNLDVLRLKEIPVFVYEIKSLEKLQIDKISLGTIPEALLSLPNFTNFYCGTCNINTLPEYLPDYNLKQLYLFMSPIDSFPSTMHKMTSLETLGVWGNGELELPEMDYSNLKFLDANEIKEVPLSLSSATQLERLTLYIINGELPEFVKDFNKLKKINLAGFSNRTQIIEIISNCNALEKIIISYNDELPPNFDLLNKLPNLEKIFFMGAYGKDFKAQQRKAQSMLDNDVIIKYY